MITYILYFLKSFYHKRWSRRNENSFGNVIFCGFRIWAIAKFITILGIIGSLFSFFFIFIFWFYAPMCLSFLMSYIIAFIGLKSKQTGHLLLALVIMVSNIIINILYVIISIAFGLFVNRDIIQNDISSYGSNLIIIGNNIQETYLFIALILLISIVYTIFSFIIIYKTHHYFTFTYPYGYYSRPQKRESDDNDSENS